MANLSEILTGLQILAKYCSLDDEVVWSSYELYAGDSNIEYTAEDIVMLEANGWFLTDYDCWGHLD